MKTKAVVCLLALGGAGLLLLTSGGTAVAGDATLVATNLTLSSVAGGDEHAFVGDKKCKMCHIKEFKSWEKTPHAKAMDLLKPGEAAEAKTKFNLDPQKDYTKDDKCLGCHTTGYGMEGGYAVPKDEKEEKKMAPLAAVGCEDCHGAGADYLALKKEIKKEKRKYKFSELAALGMNEVTADTCKKCHNDKSPTFEESKLPDFAKVMMQPEVTHEHEPLEQRED